MGGLLSFVGGLARGGLAADTGRLEGEEVRRQREERTLLAQLARARQAEQDALANETTRLQQKNLIDLMADRATDNARLAQPDVPKIVAPKPTPKQEERAEQGGVAIYEDGNFKSWKIQPPQGGDRVNAATRTKLAEGAGQLDAIKQARDAIVAYPAAVGLKRGASLLPGMGKIGSVVNQHTDPKGNEARQHLANIASLKIHDRSGAAVSVSEFPRLAPFVPQEYDTPEKVLANLDAMERELRVVLKALQDGALLADLAGGGDGGVSQRPLRPAPMNAPPDFDAWLAARGRKP